MYATVCCPNDECRAVFDVAVGRLGRNVYCLECGRRMTAKRTDVEALLRRREADTAGTAGADIARLPLVVLVDSVRSLWNVGSIFRSADACAVEKILLCGITGAPPRKEISKTALGADEVVGWSYHADALDALEEACADGCVPVALESTETSVPLEELSWPGRPCLIVGNEVDGVSPRLLERCELHAAIPMGGVKESFNVAVAFGIAAHRASRALVPDHSRVRFR